MQQGTYTTHSRLDVGGVKSGPTTNFCPGAPMQNNLAMLLSGLTCGDTLVVVELVSLVEITFCNQDSHHKHTHTSSNLGLMVGSLQSASLISGIWYSKGYLYKFLEHKHH